MIVYYMYDILYILPYMYNIARNNPFFNISVSVSLVPLEVRGAL